MIIGFCFRDISVEHDDYYEKDELASTLDHSLGNKSERSTSLILAPNHKEG